MEPIDLSHFLPTSWISHQKIHRDETMAFLTIEAKIPPNFPNVPIETLILKKSFLGNMIG